MITASFKKKNGNICGFRVSGHSGYAEAGSDIVCAAVSAMVMLTVNIITEDLGIQASLETDEENALIAMSLSSTDKAAIAVLSGLEREISNLAADYPKNVRVIK
ncbi:MAG: ribosomal-processing cysteine protease Prp [Clostridia bacterium]|nr:ribosomal-processing cysteine protease Prp [Clostridia bacterium]MBQ9848929.1 ribosomal-processing cysteine protease Prp [Clostridia bacterium]